MAEEKTLTEAKTSEGVTNTEVKVDMSGLMEMIAKKDKAIEELNKRLTEMENKTTPLLTEKKDETKGIVKEQAKVEESVDEEKLEDTEETGEEEETGTENDEGDGGETDEENPQLEERKRRQKETDQVLATRKKNLLEKEAAVATRNAKRTATLEALAKKEESDLAKGAVECTMAENVEHNGVSYKAGECYKLSKILAGLFERAGYLAPKDTDEDEDEGEE